MKYIPDEQQIERLLAGSQPTFSHRLDQRLANAPWTIRAAARRRALNIAIFTILFLGLSFSTPVGQTLAQTVFHFFVRADRDRYPLQSWQMTPPVQTSPQSPFQLSVQEAETRAAYDVFSPVDVPAGMIFVGAGYDEKYHIVSQTFGQNVEYIELSLWQQPLDDYQPCGNVTQLCENMLGMNFVGASAYIEPVQLDNGLIGEYLEGVWELTNNGPVWNPTPYSKILRWQTDTMIFELVYNGIDLTRADLVDLANNIR